MSGQFGDAAPPAYGAVPKEGGGFLSQGAYGQHPQSPPYREQIGEYEPTSSTAGATAPSAPNQELVATLQVSSEVSSEFTVFSEKSIRLGFVRKIFATLALQMIITGGILGMFLYWEELKTFSQGNSWLYIAAMCLYFVLVITLGCVGDIHRKWPVNIILLILITLCMSCMLGTIASFYDTEEVMMAVGIVALVTIAMSLLGVQTKVDFTWATGIACILTMCLAGFGLMCLIFRTDILYIVYAALGAMSFSFWLLVDIQLVMGGKMKAQIDPEEYIFAALNIYIDIIHILIFALMIIRCSKH